MWGRLFKKDELECEWKLREGEEKENCMHNTWLPQQCFHSTDSDRQMPVICYPIFGPKVQTYHMALSVTVKKTLKQLSAVGNCIHSSDISWKIGKHTLAYVLLTILYTKTKVFLLIHPTLKLVVLIYPLAICFSIWDMWLI